LRIVRIAVEPPVQFAVFQNRAQDQCRRFIHPAGALLPEA
jgi:hypothetical protein